MNRDRILKDVLALENSNICLELATGTGKTKLAIERLKQRKCKKVLIVIPRLVLIDNWKRELGKWGYIYSPIFTTYVSLHKHIGEYDAVIYDEAHHITDRCYEAIEHIYSRNNIFLSATLKKDMKFKMRDAFGDITYYRVNIQQAIDGEILPEPKILLLPLYLDTKNADYELVIHPSGKITKEVLYRDRWKYMRDKNIKLVCKCTQWQYMDYLNKNIDFYKKRYMISRNEVIKNKWLHLAGERLKFLAECKNKYVLRILESLKDERTVTFCSSIKQTEELGKYCINSQNKQSTEYLDAFNEGKINHITSVNILNEGVNLINCKYGIFAVLNSSEIMQIQKIGRILRHKEPVLIFPYYKDTREAVILHKMLENYDESFVSTIIINKI